VSGSRFFSHSCNCCGHLQAPPLPAPAALLRFGSRMPATGLPSELPRRSLPEAPRPFRRAIPRGAALGPRRTKTSLQLLGQEIFPLHLPAFGRCNHPAGHPPTAGPGILRVLRVSVLDRYTAFAVAGLAEEVLDLKSMLLHQRENTLPQFSALRTLLLDFQALNAGLHLRQLGIRHTLDAAGSCHFYLHL